MYKVLIIDDETIIAEGLARMIPWAEYGCGVAGVAYNTAEGVRLIREISPDVLLTDIRMPDGDGLSMLAGLRTSFPDMQITVLTGYREFNYAQQAIRLGVTRFLLKPSKMEELIEALAAMTEMLNKQNPPEFREEKHEGEAASFVVRQAVAYIEAHSAEKISLSDVADACFVSQWHLSKLLNKFTGKNFYDILNTARVTQAKKLMLNPALRIGDISDRVGYVDTPHFSKVFKKIEGISAAEYRNAKI